MALGRKTGGRQKGTPNKATVEKELRAQHGVANAVASGVMPLDVIVSVMRGENKYTQRQYQAAIDAAPYMHSRLSSTTVTHRDALDELALDELRAFLAMAAHTATISGEAVAGEDSAAYPRIEH